MPPPNRRDPAEPIQNWRVESWYGTDENGNPIEVPAPPDPGSTARNHEEILQRLDRIETFYRGQQEAEAMRTLLMNLGDPYNRAGEQISEELIAHSPLLQLFVRRMQEYGFVRRLRAGTVTIMPPVNQTRVPESVFNAETIARAREGPALTPGLGQVLEEARRIIRAHNEDGSGREHLNAPDGSQREGPLSAPSSDIHYRELVPSVINTPGFIPAGPMRDAMLAAGGREDPPGSGIFPPYVPETEQSIPEEIGDGEEL